MALQGSISDFGLSDIFQLIMHQKKTGDLSLKTKTEEYNISFENGMVVLAEPSNQDPLNRIGEKLVRSGRITDEQLQDALKQQKQSKEKVGQILLSMGLIGRKDMIKGLGFQVKETLYGLFRITEGDYSFTSREVSYDKNFWEPINTEFILMEGVRRVDEWPMIEKVIPSFALIFGKIDENAEKIQGVKKDEDDLDDMFDEAPSEEGLFLTKDEMTAYESINGTRSVRNIIDSMGIGDFEACKALSNLLTAGLIQVLKVPQTVPSTPKPVGVKVPGLKRKPIFTSRNIGTFFLFSALIALTLFNVGNFLPAINRSANLFEPYKNLILNSQYQQLSFSIQVFVDKEGRVPQNLNELSNGVGIPADLLVGPWGETISYEVKGDGKSFVLRVPPGKP